MFLACIFSFITPAEARWLARGHDPEYRAFGYPIDHRYGRFEEAIKIIHGLLREGSIDFDGTYYQARECELRPRGPQPGGPQIMIGARGKKMLHLTAQYADLWNKNVFLRSGHSRPEDLNPENGLLDAACKDVGRDPATLGRTALMLWKYSDKVEVNVPGYGEPLTGKPDEIARVFREFARVGVSHLQVGVIPNTLAGVESFGSVLDALDQTN